MVGVERNLGIEIVAVCVGDWDCSGAGVGFVIVAARVLGLWLFAKKKEEEKKEEKASHPCGESSL